jgi:hypothetical protein
MDNTLREWRGGNGSVMVRREEPGDGSVWRDPSTPHQRARALGRVSRLHRQLEENP